MEQARDPQPERHEEGDPLRRLVVTLMIIVAVVTLTLITVGVVVLGWALADGIR